jgi:hypothetical protein
MMPYDYNTMSRLNREERMRERDQIREAHLFTRAARAAAQTVKTVERSRVRVGRALRVAVGALHF